MKLKEVKSKSKKITLVLSLVLSVAVGFGIFENLTVKAEKQRKSAKSFLVNEGNNSAVNIEENSSPWIKMRQGKAIESEFVGTESAIGRFESNSLSPTTLVSADFNFDGYPDVIGGLAGANGGVLTLHKAWNQAFAPDDAQVLAGIKNGEFPATYEKEAKVLEVPVSPDFIVTGKFVKGSPLDLIVGSRNSSSVYLLTSDRKGGFNAPREIRLDGEVTAMAADTLSVTKGFTGLVVATKNENGFSALVFDGANDINSSKLKRVSLSHETTSLILTSPDGLTTDKDLFLLGGGELSRISGIGKNVSAPTRIDVPFAVSDFATGEFIRDRLAKVEIAVLAENGNVYYLQNGALDKRPFTESEMRAKFDKEGRGRTVVVNSEDSEASAFANNWSIAEEQNLGVNGFNRQNSQTLLRKSYITGNETEDLMVVNPAENKIQILFKEPNNEPNRLSFTGDTKIENIVFPADIAAALPVRLNVMGQQGIAVFQNGKLEPTPVMLAPQAIFTVSKVADTNDGACNADCSLREAVVAANGAAGSDMITFTPNGNHQITISSPGEDAAAGGDLDITQALTITGNGNANTFLQGGAAVGTGIDKVLSINPTFTLAFATSITGVTVRFGNNPTSFATDGFGGGFDWEGSGTGTLTVTNSIVTDNRSVDGDGGGIAATNSSAGAGTFTMSGSTVSNNVPGRVAANSPVGGAIFAGTLTPFMLTNVTISGNNVNGSGGAGQGGGIFAFGPSGVGGTSFLNGSSVTGNAAPSDGGGLRTTQRIDFNTGSTGNPSISNNTSGTFGGGLFINQTSATSTFNELTMTGNSATTTGGAIYLGTTTTANVLNLNYLRIVGNTSAGFTGLATAGGVANATNNWWGCNTGPTSAPCNTAGVVAGVGTANTNPWLQLRISAAPTSLVYGQTTTLTASFLLNSAGAAVAASNLDALIGLPVTWGGTGGTVTPTNTTIQNTGTATASYLATSIGAGTGTATVDSATPSVSLTIAKASTSSAVNSPSNPVGTGVPVTFTATVSPVAPGSGTRTGTVNFLRNGSIVCGAVPVNGSGQATCNVTFSVAGNYNIQVIYSGDTNFNASTSPTYVQQVLGPTAASVGVSGKIISGSSGRGINNARVTLTDSLGQSRSVSTNQFGYYRFTDVPSGGLYTFTVSAKGYQTQSVVRSISDEISDMDIQLQNN